MKFAELDPDRSSFLWEISQRISGAIGEGACRSRLADRALSPPSLPISMDKPDFMEMARIGGNDDRHYSVGLAELKELSRSAQFLLGSNSLL
jgi:hypothetical protein